MTAHPWNERDFFFKRLNYNKIVRKLAIYLEQTFDEADDIFSLCESAHDKNNLEIERFEIVRECIRSIKN